MRRHLFNVAAALSLLLFVATAGSFVRSRGSIEWVEYASTSRWSRLVGRPVGVFVSTAQDQRAQPGFSVGRQDAPAVDFPGYRMVIGFSVGTFNSTSGTVRYLLLPYWFVALVTGALPALWLLLWWRRRRTGVPGLCAACGYDLRASAERCPECGEPILAAPADPLPAA
jgi:hypothetical protein